MRSSHHSVPKVSVSRRRRNKSQISEGEARRRTGLGFQAWGGGGCCERTARSRPVAGSVSLVRVSTTATSRSLCQHHQCTLLSEPGSLLADCMMLDLHPSCSIDGLERAFLTRMRTAQRSCRHRGVSGAFTRTTNILASLSKQHHRMTLSSRPVF